MYPTHNWKEKSLLFMRVFLPILIYQLASYSASFVDTMMTGQYSTLDLAGVSVASNLWNPFFSFLTGIVSALVPIVGQQLGKGDQKTLVATFHQFVYLASGLAVLLFALVWLLALPFMEGFFSLEEAVLATAKAYLAYLSLGVLPLLLFSVCRSFFDALGLTRLSMYLMLLLIPFNFFFNTLFIYGKFGLSAMGGAGAGLGTALSYWSLLVVILCVMHWHPTIRSYGLWSWTPPNRALLKEAIGLGLPIGLQIFAEVAIFAVVSLSLSRFSSQVIAAHQAAMNVTSFLYAFPASVSSALPIVIAYELGAKRWQDAKDYARVGRLLALAFAVGTLTFLYFFREQVAGLYSQEPDFIAQTAYFLTFALFFQLVDAFTAPIQGILRGYKDATIPFVLGLISYWSVTFPLAWFLEEQTSLGAAAYWVGLIVGIAVCGLMLHWRLLVLMKRQQTV